MKPVTEQYPKSVCQLCPDAYILTFGILAMITIYPYGNLQPVDAYFFGVSASTESGLNPYVL